MIGLSKLLNAQEKSKYVISGKVTEKSSEPLPYASVSLHKIKDSSLVTGKASNKKGHFELKAPNGKYYLKIHFLSFQEKYKKIKVSGKNVDLGKIVMKPNSKSLDDVKVKGEKKRMVMKLDKKVFNIDKDLNNAGGNAAQVLNNTPSVNVDMEGNVKLRGSDNVRILINGKPSGMFSNGNSEALRNLNASMIEKIEVITNPSARYDAEGEAGVINIVLKDQQKGGLNGSFNLSTGYPHDHGGGFNLNYRKGIINVFGSYSFNYDKRPGFGKSTQ
ncbi:MAG: carboxypeptidase-like regulatory domain-containing protein, partial [Flavobacteriales bacterium]